MVNQRLDNLQQVMNQIDDRVNNAISRERAYGPFGGATQNKGRGEPFAILLAHAVPAEPGFSTTSSASTILDHCFYFS